MLFMYMANMGWNSAMNTASTIEMLTAKTATGEYRIPRIIYSDAYFSEMVAYADLVLPDTTYLERWDCISLLDRPISRADGPADSIRQPVVAPDRDVRPFQDVLLDLGAGSGSPGMVMPEGNRRYPKRLCRLHGQSRARPRDRAACRLPRRDGRRRQRRAQPRSAPALYREWLLLVRELPLETRYYSSPIASISTGRSVRFHREGGAIVMQLYCEELQKFRLAAQGHGDVQPPSSIARASRVFRSFAVLVSAFRGAGGRHRFLSAARDHPAADGHVPLLGLENAWLSQIIGRNWLYMTAAGPAARARGRRLGARQSSHGEIGAVRLMSGLITTRVDLERDRQTQRRLEPGEGRARSGEGFLLNHLIADLLPERDGGFRYANGDPVTGQAAWYDLRVSIEGSRRNGLTRRNSPRSPAAGPASRDRRFRYGHGCRAMTTLPHPRPGRPSSGW